MFNDSRFGTLNTNLAACLGALRIPLKNAPDDKGVMHPDYIRKIQDAETGKTAVHWFFELRGQEHSADQIESYWRHREDFEREQPEHPLIPMRRALEKLEWVTKVWWGNIVPEQREGIVEFTTRDTDLVACLMGIGITPIEFNQRTKEFGFKGFGQGILIDYENYRDTTHLIGKMRLVLEVRKLMIAELKRSDLVTQVHYKNGDPLNGGRELFVVKDQCTASQLEALVSKLYE